MMIRDLTVILLDYVSLTEPLTSGPRLEPRTAGRFSRSRVSYTSRRQICRSLSLALQRRLHETPDSEASVPNALAWPFLSRMRLKGPTKLNKGPTFAENAMWLDREGYLASRCSPTAMPFPQPV